MLCYLRFMQEGEEAPVAAVFTSGQDIPRSAKLIRITQGYRDLKDEIPCGLPGCHQGHKNGFVVQYTCDGVTGEGVVGKDCGRKHFGLADWRTQVTALRARERLAEVSGNLAAAVAACQDLLPHVAVLKEAASLMAAVRQVFETHASSFATICEDAGRRHDGVLTWQNWDVRPMKVDSIRLPGREFWFRKGLAAQVGRLEADLRLFPERALGVSTPKEVSQLLGVLGVPHERARELCRMVASDMRALLPDNVASVLRVQRLLFRDAKLRLHDAQLQVKEVAWWEPERPTFWRTLADLNGVPALMRCVEKVSEALSVRRVT